MGSYTSVSITPGIGAPIDTFVKGNGSHDQVFRTARVESITTNAWTISTSASSAQIPADVNRLMLLMVVDFTATARVYMRFDTTNPTASLYHWYLDPGDRYEVPREWCSLPVSMVGATTAGTLLSTLGVAS